MDNVSIFTSSTNFKYSQLIILAISTQLKQLRKESLKNSGFKGIQTYDLCDAGALLYRLTNQANWELVILWVRNILVIDELMNVNTVELRLYDRRFNDIPDLTINILCPGSMYGYLYIGSSFTTITRLKDMMLLSPCHFVKSRFHCNELTTLVWQTQIAGILSLCVYNWGFLYTYLVRLLILISLAVFLIRLLRRNKMPNFRR